MASFGKRAVSASSNVPWKTDTFRRMMEEEAEREQWAKDAEQVASTGSTGSPSKEISPPRKKGPDPRIFFQIEIRGKFNGKLSASGRLEFELFASSVPKAAENVRCLCTGEKGKSLHYENSRFHRIVRGLYAQGGDITFGDGGGADGDGGGSGRSIYGNTFADEGFVHQHDRRGTLSMANMGPNSNNSQIMILFGVAPQLDGKHVVVGKLIKEEDSILQKMEECGSKTGRVDQLVSIVGCGEVGKRAAPRLASRSRSRNRGSRGGPWDAGRRRQY